MSLSRHNFVVNCINALSFLHISKLIVKIITTAISQSEMSLIMRDSPISPSDSAHSAHTDYVSDVWREKMGTVKTYNDDVIILYEYGEILTLVSISVTIGTLVSRHC